MTNGQEMKKSAAFGTHGCQGRSALGGVWLPLSPNEPLTGLKLGMGQRVTYLQSMIRWVGSTGKEKEENAVERSWTSPHARHLHWSVLSSGFLPSVRSSLRTFQLQGKLTSVSFIPKALCRRHSGGSLDFHCYYLCFLILTVREGGRKGRRKTC